MDTGDFPELTASPPGKIETTETCSDDLEPGEVSPVESSHELLESHNQIVFDSEDGGTISVVDSDFHGNLVTNAVDIDMDVDPAEPLRLLDKSDLGSLGLTSEDGAISHDVINYAAEEETFTISTSSHKRARMEHDVADQPSVHVTYKFLNSSSRQKLEELLKQWSEWHTQCGSSLATGEEVHSGEETFFPALQINVGKPFALSFWLDQQTARVENEEVVSFDAKTVPLYDRGYSLGLNTENHSSNLEGGLEIVDDAARCFNCGSYSHSLKECPKPRDHVAVSNARKQQRSKRNQNAASRGATRYYQDLPPGKFDGLRPGALDSETRKMLGLGELDPPPWLNRMRELGYPPGYLEVDVDSQPSGIVMYAEEEGKVGEEEGEISEFEAGPPKKMTIEFPGINAPVPENADEWRWTARTSRSESSRFRSHDRTSNYSLPVDIPNVEDHRWSSYVRDDPLPGTEPMLSPPSPIQSSSQHAQSPIVSSSLYERGGRSHYEDYYSSHSSYSSRGHSSPGRYEDSVSEGRHGYSVKEGRRYHVRDYLTEGRRSSSYGHRSWR
ncbi:hypothetical protein MLD38_013131 [Melastoma candidum]|uniref:Uncharacterized protein n=1 Tax=Melastoma candidum TaxID=119954 RepID=A0ACB9RAF6_9MYRT|nr:hypothetical protein MLD38_013131 [Melastoma candidum]